MTALSTQLAVCAAALTMPFTNDAERHAMRAKLQWIASGVQALEQDYSAARITLDGIYNDAAEQARLDDARVERLAPPMLAVFNGGKP